MEGVRNTVHCYVRGYGDQWGSVIRGKLTKSYVYDRGGRDFTMMGWDMGPPPRLPQAQHLPAHLKTRKTE